MNTIKILGTGCPSCNKTEAIVKDVITELQCDIKIEKVTDIQEIMAYDIMSTPAIVIDEKVMIKGHMPSKDEIKKLLKDNCCSDSDTSCCSENSEIIQSPLSETKDKKSNNCC